MRARIPSDGELTPCQHADTERKRRVAAIVVGALGIFTVAVFLFFSFGTRHIDLDVYRIGARVFLDKGDLYGVIPPTRDGTDLPFTYPPLAAVLLSPLAVLPLALDGLLATLSTVVLLIAVLRLFLRTAGLARPAVNWVVLGILPFALLLDPVRVALVDGQIDVALMALVAWDTLGGGVRVGGRHVHGALVGLAAAVKLTPAVFVLYFLVRGERRAALVAAGSFAGFTALGFLAAPNDSTVYWTHTVFQTERIGAVWYAANQSLTAVLARTGLPQHERTALWLALSLVVLLLAWRAMRRAVAYGGDSVALVFNALAELLISPISWTHHWVWIVPGLTVFADWARRVRVSRAVVVAGFALFAVGPQWLLPHTGDRELRWALWEQLLGGAYVWFALSVLVMATWPYGSRESRVVAEPSHMIN
jgi:alpha-1,2-mannosyltransferase